jgi:hypothetical protein
MSRTPDIPCSMAPYPCANCRMPRATQCPYEYRDLDTATGDGAWEAGLSHKNSGRRRCPLRDALLMRASGRERKR